MANGTCSIDGCPKSVLARGWCGKHYGRWHRHGDPAHERTRRPDPVKPKPPVVGMHDAAWFAGLFEGEGTIHIRPDGVVRLAILMNDRDVLEMVDALFPSRSGVHPVTRKNAPSHWKQSYTWYIGRRPDVERCLRAMIPWLGERRRARALEALYALATQHPGTTGHQWRAKTHCPQGHPYDEANTYWYAGRRFCRTCRQEKKQARQARARAEQALGGRA